MEDLAVVNLLLRIGDQVLEQLEGTLSTPYPTCGSDTAIGNSNTLIRPSQHHPSGTGAPCLCFQGKLIAQCFYRSCRIGREFLETSHLLVPWDPCRSRSIRCRARRDTRTLQFANSSRLQFCKCYQSNLCHDYRKHRKHDEGRLDIDNP